MFDLDYEICTVFITVIILIMCFSGKDKRNKQFYLYISMVVSLMIASVSNIAASYFSNNIEKFSVWMVYAFNYVYFTFKALVAMLFFVYNIEITEKISEWRKLLWTVIIVPIATVISLLALNPITRFIFAVNKYEGYVRGSGIWILYLVSAFYMTFTFIYVIKLKKIIGMWRVKCVEVFVIVTLIHVLLQYYFPKYLMEGFGEALCLLLVYFTIQKPESLMDGHVSTYNRKAFMDKAKLLFTVKIPFNVISVSVEDYDYLEKTFGIETMSNYVVKLAEYLNNKAKKYEIYRISEYMFYLTTRENDMEAISKFTSELCVECDRNWLIGEIEIPAILDICVVKCLEDVSDINELFACTNYFANEDHGKKTRVVFASDNEYFKGKRNSKIKLAIHRALKENTFQVYFQPIYSNESQKINSAEALVRLIDEEMGFVSPEEFIPIAEEDGSILKIDDFVLEEVCKFIKDNNIEEKGIKYIEVNVSVIECMKHDMAKRVADMIEKYGLKSGQINLEITETATIYSPQMLGINMNKLVSGGVRFSLDDYGTGNSNINSLISLPFHLIKIDKGIVWSSFKNEKAGIALESSVNMIKKLGFHIVAEGIETLEQAEKLSEMGCEFLQGYYYSKPLTKDKFLDFINSNE